jgi:hypothetical protein
MEGNIKSTKEKKLSFDKFPPLGTIDQLNVTHITVTYAPTAFCTSRLSVAIVVSQFHIQPFICTFIGKCLPGLAR